MAIDKTQGLKRKAGNLKNKRILITAGPTWVPIDSVRVISNTASGETGIILSEKLSRLGAKVVLLLGSSVSPRVSKRIRLVRFRFFDELERKLKKELESHELDAVIHSAAVSDYRLRTKYNNKLSSGIKELKLRLVPTPKLIDDIKKADDPVFLVGFKFEPLAEKKSLIKKAKDLMDRSGLDLAVANCRYRKKYRAFVISKKRVYGPFASKNSLADNLIKLISANL